MGNKFFSKADYEAINATVERLERINGISAYGKRQEIMDSNSCDKWDCAIKCYCAQSYED